MSERARSHECGACGGSGTVLRPCDCEGHGGSGYFDCPVCLGSGRISDVMPVADAIADCYYCGRGPASPVVVPEPTEHGTYKRMPRVLCAGCYEEYRAVPYGFELES